MNEYSKPSKETNDAVIKLLESVKPRKSYKQQLEEFLGYKLPEPKRPKKPYKGEREDRILKILERRYNVPSKWIEEIRDAVHSDW